MTRVREWFAWLLLVPVGSVLLMAALVVGLPSALLGLVGMGLWRWADRLLKRPRPELGDDVILMLDEHGDVQDRLWQAYLSHPSAREQARRQVRGER